MKNSRGEKKSEKQNGFMENLGEKLVKACSLIKIKIVNVHFFLVLSKGKFRKVQNSPGGSATDKTIRVMDRL